MHSNRYLQVLSLALFFLQACPCNSFVNFANLRPPKSKVLLPKTGSVEHSFHILSVKTTSSNEKLELDQKDTPRNDAASSSSTENFSHENFDFLSHWYPMTWARDLELDKPTKLTLFDVDYVVAKIKKEGKDEEVIAMLDQCPHKSAALSEGRVTKHGKSFQCAYHGWTFDSKTGECIDIPQIAPNQKNAGNVKGTAKREERKRGIDVKSNGVAVPAAIVDGMVWIFPGGGLEQALLAPPPPTIPDLSKDGFRSTGQVVRDFPIDWTILIENIMDPDHGLFAHQQKAFDLYTASSRNPQIIEESSINNGKGWTITSKVNATYELLQRNEEEMMVSGQKKKKRKYATDKGVQISTSTTTFVAPSLIYMGRRNDQNNTNFVSAFFVSPTGTGKSRFMACQISRTPQWINIPRWIGHVIINNFLDQDTFLLATQQRHVLACESQLSLGINQERNDNLPLPVRKSLYKYRSPTEKLGSKVGIWLDATISKVPNRLPTVQSLGGYRSALNTLSASRREVLDRYRQHTSICNDSMKLVKKCQSIRNSLKVISSIPILLRILMSFTAKALDGGRISPISSFLLFLNHSLPQKVVIFTWTVSAIVIYLCRKIEDEFKFKYTEEYRDKDMDKIPTIWMDQL